MNRGGPDCAALLSTNTLLPAFSLFLFSLDEKQKTKRHFLPLAGLFSASKTTETTARFIMCCQTVIRSTLLLLYEAELGCKVSLFQVRENKKTRHVFNFQIHH